MTTTIDFSITTTDEIVLLSREGNTNQLLQRNGFGALRCPFFVACTWEMCETHPVLCETFSKVPAVAGGTDCWRERLRETFGIGRYGFSNADSTRLSR